MALTTEDIKAIRTAHPVGWFVRAQQRAINQRAQDRLIAEASVLREKELVERLDSEHKRELTEKVQQAEAMAKTRNYDQTNRMIDKVSATHAEKVKDLEYKIGVLNNQISIDSATLTNQNTKLRAIRSYVRDHILGDNPDETVLVANIEIVLDQDKSLTRAVETVRRQRENTVEF